MLATPAQDAGDLVGSFAPGLAGLLGRMQSASAVSVYLAFRRENVAHLLDSSGFLSSRSEARAGRGVYVDVVQVAGPQPAGLRAAACLHAHGGRRVHR